MTGRIIRLDVQAQLEAPAMKGLARIGLLFMGCKPAMEGDYLLQTSALLTCYRAWNAFAGALHFSRFPSEFVRSAGSARIFPIYIALTSEPRKAITYETVPAQSLFSR